LISRSRMVFRAEGKGSEAGALVGLAPARPGDIAALTQAVSDTEVEQHEWVPCPIMVAY
jgi:hypothetical protein